jgi:hypothetical protein
MSEPDEPPEELLRAIGCEPGEEPLDTFARSQKGKAGSIFGPLGFVALGIGFLALFGAAAVGIPKREVQLITFGFGIAPFVLSLALARRWIAHYRSTADLVNFHERGLIWRTPRDGWSAARWGDAVAFWQRETGAIGPEASHFRVEFADGREARYTAQLENYHGLAERAIRALHRHLLPVLKARLEAGEPVEFGPVTLTKTELTTERTKQMSAGRYPLSEVRDAAIGFGGLWLNQHIPGPARAFVVLTEIPNYTVFIALLPVVPVNWNPAALE